MNELVNKQLIFDCFAGNVTSLQRKLIDEWCLEPQNEEIYFQWLEEWESSHLQYIADKQSALNRYHDFLYGNPAINEQPDHTPIASLPPTLVSRRAWTVWLVAASVTMVAMGLLFQLQLLNRTYSTAYGQTQVVSLPDGSKVTLNANSILRVPRFGFGNQTRKVWLEGEAIFSVMHTKTNQQFVVTTDNNADVVVLGTEFTLFARPRGTKVILHRGKVEFHYQQADQEERQVTMKPGDQVDLSKNGVALLTKATHMELAWRDHRYTFDQTSLREVTYLFRENFRVTLEISDPETASLTLSGTYPAQNATELLQIIAEALNIQIIRQDDKVLLAPKPL